MKKVGDGFPVLAVRFVAPHIPQRPRGGALAAELRHRAVDCNTPTMGDDTVFLFAAVHLEQHFESISCHCPFLGRCKMKHESVYPCHATYKAVEQRQRVQGKSLFFSFGQEIIIRFSDYDLKIFLFLSSADCCLVASGGFSAVYIV